jgi:hypothetical protein
MKEETSVAIFFSFMLLLVFWIILFWVQKEREAIKIHWEEYYCIEKYGNTTYKNTPAKCIKYFNNQE